MKHDLADGPLSFSNSFDVCVVGAGAAGIVLAVELLRAGKRVVLLESGGDQLEAATQDLYRSDVVGQRHTGVHDGRFRTWGGTTTRWGGQVLELEPIDFARREWIAGNGWPIDKAKLQSGYDTAIRLEGLTNAVPGDAALWERTGSEVPNLGTGLEPYFTRWCPQPNFALLHGETLLSDTNLTVILHANLLHLHVNEGRQRVQEAVFQSLNGHSMRIFAREFVLTIGTIETSRLLLNLADAQGARWNPNGLVGCHFQDHVDCEVGAVQPMDKKRFAAAFTNVLLDGFKYHPKFRLTAAEQGRLGVLNVAGTIVFKDSTEEITGAVKATGRRLLRRAWGEIDRAQIVNLLKHLPLLLQQTWSYAVRHRVYNSPATALALRVHCEQQPDSASRIRLSDDRDALGMRRVRLDWQISALELRTIRTFAEEAARALEVNGLAMVHIVNDLQDDAALRLRCDDGLHHIGGAVMSSDPKRGVVDTDLRLHGVPNLSLCSAAVFPTGGYSNPTHTVLALAVRLAQRLATA
ncbi:MAG: GMC oxidoreductase [Janthinobacterium lividum]